MSNDNSNTQEKRKIETPTPLEFAERKNSITSNGNLATLNPEKTHFEYALKGKNKTLHLKWKVNENIFVGSTGIYCGENSEMFVDGVSTNFGVQIIFSSNNQ